MSEKLQAHTSGQRSSGPGGTIFHNRDRVITWAMESKIMKLQTPVPFIQVLSMSDLKPLLQQ